jgi:zinc transport system permease protein
MNSFFEAIATHSFMRNALLAGILASVACGSIGTYVVVRRITLIAGSIGHAVLGGMGAAYYFRIVYDLEWLHPLYGAVVAALVSAVAISLVRMYGREREDTVISAVWAVGVAVGILFIFRTPGYRSDVMTYLFGNIVMADAEALRLLAGLDVLIVALVLLFYNQLMAVCFDEEFAKLRGIRTGLFYTLLLCMIALTIVTLIYVVGIVMVIALLTLPVALAGHLTKRLWKMMVLGAILSACFTTVGLAIGYTGDLPAGAMTVLLTAVAYVLVRLAAPLKRATAPGKRRRTE